MTLGDAITILRRIIGRQATPADVRRYHIEHQALVDLFDGLPFDDQRWNITEAYARGSLQLELEGKGQIHEHLTKEDV